MEKPDYCLSPEEALARLESSTNGLDETEARSRLERYGPNELEVKKGVPPLKILLRQFKNIMTAVLVAAALIIQQRWAKTGEPAPGLWKGRQWGKIIYILGALSLYAFFLEFLGYLISTFLLMFFLFRAVEKQKWPVVILGSLSTSLLTYGLFKIWLQVQLPVGLWGV